MKNLLTLMLILMFNTFASFSQEKGYIAISIGPSIPTGEFASKNMDNESSGFANTGAIFDISFAYKLNKNFGLTAVLRGQANEVDAQALSKEMSKQLTSDITNSVSTGSWGIGGLLVGGYATVPFAKQLSFESRLMLGFITSTSPDMTINLSSPNGSAWVKQSSATAPAFAYLAGIGIKYDVAKRVCLLTNFDYLGANPQFVDVETTNSLGGLGKNDFTQAFGSVNIGFGVGFRL
jgi:hypothetical protein